ncbi:MAG: hypothetical protein AAGJ40_09380 [Planctomycetota bacterium]
MELLIEVQRLNALAREEDREEAKLRHEENIKEIQIANSISEEARADSKLANKIANEALNEARRMSRLHVTWIWLSIGSLIISLAALAVSMFAGS